jgi:hypothetical protein
MTDERNPPLNDVPHAPYRPQRSPNVTREEATVRPPLLTLPLPCRRKLCKRHGGRFAFYEDGTVKFEWKSPHEDRSDANSMDAETLLGILAANRPGVLIDMLERLLAQKKVA